VIFEVSVVGEMPQIREKTQDGGVQNDVVNEEYNIL
jgi:hypothetical protein